MTEHNLPDKDDAPWLDCMDGFKTLSDAELLETLDQATVTCSDCGDKYGVYSVRYSSWWVGKCHVCGEEKTCHGVARFRLLLYHTQKIKCSACETKVKSV
jgi:hypothetical protein